MPEIHAARRERARQKIAEAGADAALITSGPNVRYLTGLASSNAALLLLASGPAVLATDSRYALAAAAGLSRPRADHRAVHRAPAGRGDDPPRPCGPWPSRRTR